MDDKSSVECKTATHPSALDEVETEQATHTLLFPEFTCMFGEVRTALKKEKINYVYNYYNCTTIIN